MPSLLEAIEQKYGESSTESEGSEEEGISVSIYVPQKSPRSIIPSLLVLNDCDIATAGEQQALVDKCATVEELDLAKNKLNYWPEVFRILKQMPRLRFVNLSFNQLSMPLNKDEVDINIRWEYLRNLVLNSTQIDWESVQQILEYSPTLEELHLSLNEYNNVNLCGDTCKCAENIETNNVETECKCACPKIDYKKKHKHLGVRKLHFTGNPVSRWTEVKKLGYAFPNLESLVLADCPIKTLDILGESEEGNHEYLRCESECESGNSVESPHDSFRQLKFLNLNATRLCTWDEIERLSKFPALQCLRVQGCPLWDGNEYTEHERRQLLIARLPNVEMLNGGGNIEHHEREDSERAFIRYYMDKPESDRPERYFELVSIHGKLDPLVNVDLRPEKRVKVTFTCGLNSEVRSVDVYRTVSDLKTKLEPFAGFSAAKMRLFYVDQELRDMQILSTMNTPIKNGMLDVNGDISPSTEAWFLNQCRELLPISPATMSIVDTVEDTSSTSKQHTGSSSMVQRAASPIVEVAPGIDTSHCVSIDGIRPVARSNKQLVKRKNPFYFRPNGTRRQVLVWLPSGERIRMYKDEAVKLGYIDAPGTNENN